MTTTLLISLLSLHILAVMSPGPDFFVVIKNTLNNGKLSGIVTAIGIGLGISFHIAYSIVGLGYIISQSILLYTAIKIIGGCYLLYIAYMSWKSTGSNIEIQKLSHETSLSIPGSFWNGFLTNVLNPKATLYFLSVFTTMVAPNTPTQDILMLGGLMMLTAAAWFIGVTYCFSSKTIRGYYNRSQSTINKIFAGILLLLGLKVLTSK